MTGLGYDPTRILILDRDGARIGEVHPRQSSSTAWARTNSDVSQCQTVIGEPTDALRNLEPWLHQAIVYRGAELVWRGPIVSTRATAASMSFVARDPGAYFDRRRIGQRRIFFQEDLSRIALQLITDAMSVDDPFNVVSTAAVAPTGIYATRNVFADGRMLSEELKDLVDAGLRWTFIGGRLLIGPVAQDYETATLRDRDIDGEFEVVKDGTETVTDALVVGKGVQGTAFDYGSPLGILQAMEKQDALGDAYQATNAAKRIVKERAITPRRVQLPGDTRLMPTAPLSIADLVVGAVVPVQTTATGVAVDSKMLIDGVKVSLKAGAEEVAVSLVDKPLPVDQQDLDPPPHGYATEDDNPTYGKKV